MRSLIILLICYQYQFIKLAQIVSIIHLLIKCKQSKLSN